MKLVELTGVFSWSFDSLVFKHIPSEETEKEDEKFKAEKSSADTLAGRDSFGILFIRILLPTV